MIHSAKFVISNPDVATCPQSNLPEYAFIGRSNVGKSSLINALCRNPKLAKTSHGFAQTGQKQRDKLRVMIDRYCLLRQQLVNLFVLIDCRLEPQQIDLDFMQWLGENEVPFAIVFTKADKVGKGRLGENIDNYKRRLHETWEELPTIFVTSAEKKEGTDELIAFIESINNDLRH